MPAHGDTLHSASLGACQPVTRRPGATPFQKDHSPSLCMFCLFVKERANIQLGRVSYHVEYTPISLEQTCKAEQIRCFNSRPRDVQPSFPARGWDDNRPRTSHLFFRRRIENKNNCTAKWALTASIYRQPAVTTRDRVYKHHPVSPLSPAVSGRAREPCAAPVLAATPPCRQ